MKFKRNARAVLPAFTLIWTLGLVQAAMAHGLTVPNSPSAASEWKGASTGLGSSHRFPTIGAAVNHCSNIDPVVWSDGYHLAYDLPGSKYYGKIKIRLWLLFL